MENESRLIRKEVADKHAWWSNAVKNSVAIIAWVYLAIYFGKWWIALFGLLFMTGLRTGKDAEECGEE